MCTSLFKIVCEVSWLDFMHWSWLWARERLLGDSTCLDCMGGLLGSFLVGTRSWWAMYYDFGLEENLALMSFKFGIS